MNRRKFIRGVGFISLGALLQACRVGNIAKFLREATATPGVQSPLDPPTAWPTITATATDAPTPIVLPGEPTATTLPPTATATPAATTTGSSGSPLASPTHTPLPTPTPTPTPYPPGPPSKLGLFVTRHDPKVLEITAEGQPALIKTIEFDANFVKGLKDSSPTTLIVARLGQLDQMNLDIEPGPLVQAFTEELLPLATESRRMEAILGWEAYNEPVADTPDKMKRLADFEAERTRILGEQGVRSIVGNFGAGQPPLELWPLFEPALAAIRQYGGFLGLHEYSAPVMQFRSGDLQLEGEPGQGDEGWLTLRYRKVYRQFLQPMGFGDIPLLITECGVDGLVQPRPGPAEAHGWQDFIDTWRANGLRDDPPGVYMDQLIWYDENLRQDDYVKGAAIFLAGSNDNRWNSYDILGPGAGRMGDLLQQYLAVHPPDGVTR